MKKIAIIASLILAVSVSTVATMGNWSVDSASTKANFSISNIPVGADGTFSGVTGTVNFDPENLGASNISASVQVKTLDTGISMRDSHVLNEDFLDSEKYPTITFKSSSIEKKGSAYVAIGALTIKDVTKKVRLPFTVENNIFATKFTINRLDYNVGESSWTMSNDVKIDIQLAVK